jgi:hypothetical protein
MALLAMVSSSSKVAPPSPSSGMLSWMSVLQDMPSPV